MNKGLTVLLVVSLLVIGHVAAFGQSEPFISECHDLNDNQIPDGWTQELWYGGPGVYDGAFRAFPNNGMARLSKQGTFPLEAKGIRFEYDGNIAYSYWGMHNQVRIRLSTDVSYAVRHEMSNTHFGMVTRVKIDRYIGESEVPDAQWYWDFPFEITSYHYTLTFYDDFIAYKAARLSDDAILFDLGVEVDLLDITALETIMFIVRSKTDSDAWMDNLCVEIIGGGLICDEFDGTSVDKSMWTVTTGSWSQTGGQLAGTWPITIANCDNANLLITDPLQPTGDFVFDVDMVVAPGGALSNSTKIVLRNSYQSMYHIAFNGGNGSYFLTICDNGAKSQPIPDTFPLFMNTTPGDINNVKLARSGVQYCVFLNDHFLYSFEEDHFGSDVKLGLGAYGDAKYERACIEYYDDLSPCNAEEICNAFLTPKRLAIHRPFLTLEKTAPRDLDTRNWDRHAFKIHLLPCEPLDVSVGDAAVVFVDVDANGVFDDDEQYEAVVSGTDLDCSASDIAIKVFAWEDLVDNDPLVAIYAVNGIPVADADGNDIDYLQLDTFTPGRPGTPSGKDMVPSEFTLHQNYPNPFNPETEIRFSIPEASAVRLEVYNILGEKITTLVDRRLEAGDYAVPWDSRDSRGLTVASGIYFYRITVDAWAQTRKMVLLQ